MKIYRLFLFALVFTICIGFSSSQANAQDCSLLGKFGVYDYKTTHFGQSNFKSFVDWYRSNTSTSSENERHHSVTLDVVYKYIPISGHYADGDKGISQFNQDIESYAAGNESSKQYLFEDVAQINPKVIDAMKECLIQPGLHGWLQTTYDPKIFRLALNFHLR